ncbi:hypothetical protein [Saccharicrinis fermentans]|uniref:Uncharacterized protein n=1 Tax=Saccharicrinis fermentans DSM 9555 = JCM 21142 TaxID=869213 RepID=W7YU38_9BACT|nr:hypothetical protein [Saccharicrinis fermentans]GAF05964.1 hypothetical protein JCM21142_134729 [Saccharicrinis fermentans DSM 9555 = JCM 21142]
MDGQAKVTLLLEMKNRIKTGMSEAKKKVNSGVGAMKAKLSELKKPPRCNVFGNEFAIPDVW